MKRYTATWSIVALLSALLSTSGCFWMTTKREGQQLRKDIDAMDTRLEERESDLQAKIQQLEKILDEATRILKRNSADLGADVEAMAQDIRGVQGLITEATSQAGQIRTDMQALEQTIANDREVMNKRLVSLEERLDALEQKASQPIAESADELYAQGKKSFDGADYNQARNLFRHLIIKYPGHDRADDAQYYRGESYFLEKDYEAAIRELQKVFDKYAEGALADDALFRAGEAAEALKRCSEARVYFGLLRQKYPKSPLAGKVKAKERDLKRDLKNRKKCLS